MIKKQAECNIDGFRTCEPACDEILVMQNTADKHCDVDYKCLMYKCECLHRLLIAPHYACQSIMALMIMAVSFQHPLSVSDSESLYSHIHLWYSNYI